VQIAKTGIAKPVDQLLAKQGERGIQEDTLPPGLYYLNPYAVEVVNIDIRQQRYEMTYLEGQGDTQQNDAIIFYSDDGFEIAIDVTVLFQVLPNDAPYVVATIGRSISDIKEKIIRPQARSYARILGSRYKGEDFVHGATRETFQNDLHKELLGKTLESRVQMNQALVRHFEVPTQLRQPITDKVIALKMQEKFEQEQKTQKANADLAREKEKVNFESAKVVAETKKVKAIIQAEEEREVEEINVAKKEFIAQGEAKKIQIEADATLYQKEKEAAGILAVGKAEAEAKKLELAAYEGDGGLRFAEVEKAKALGSGIEKIYYLPSDISINTIAKDFENAITVALPKRHKEKEETQP
jgi:regulator of protease activity HflC (stomatin/prohibitin superfamily)